MIVLVSLFLLDLRFVVTRADGESTRDLWIRPQWLFADRNLPQVGRLGIGTPIPGRKRTLKLLSEYASVDAGLVLQTAEEFGQKKLLAAASVGSFTLLHREIVAYKSGQVRLDLLFQCVMDSQTRKALLEELLTTDFAAPYYNGGDMVSLMNASVTVAGVYESESLKTCAGYRDTTERVNAALATRGSVLMAAEAPNVVLIDVDAELTPDGAAPLRCGQACAGGLWLDRCALGGADVLVWHFLPDRAGSPGLKDMAWDAASDLSWLLGQVHELAVFKARVDEYDLRRDRVLNDSVRSAIIERNRWFDGKEVGSWNARQVMSLAMPNLWSDTSELQRRVADILSFAKSETDKRGLGNNFIYVANQVGGNQNQILNEGIMTGTTQGNTTISGNTGSIINVGSTLTNVSQSIGALPNADQATKDQLTKLIADLQEQLQKLPADKTGEAEAVAEAASKVVSKAADPKANPGLIKLALDGLKGAVDLVKEVAPPVVTLATSIGALIAKLHGIPLPW